MEAVLFYSVVLLALYFTGKGMLDSGPGFMRLPSIFATVVLLWVLPQLFAIRLAYPDLEDPLLTLYVMIAMAMLSVRLGWSFGVSQGGRLSYRAPSKQILHYTAVVLTVIAGVTAMMIGGVGGGVGGAQTGIVTILLFFNSLRIVALFLSSFLVLRYRSPVSIALLAINLLVYGPLIFLYFRRQPMLELVVCIVLALWFARRFLVPRFLFLAALSVGYVFVSVVGDLRTLAAMDGQWSYLTISDLRTIARVATTNLSQSSGHAELLNAVHLVKVAEWHSEYSFGASSWNRLVFQWVPAQIVGLETKMSLMFENNITGRLFTLAGYEIPSGSTMTGIADAYLEFWYFGTLYFAATAYVMGRWWARAHLGDPWAMAYYVGGLGPALLTITHSAIHFFNGILLMLIMVKLIRAGLRLLPRTRPHRHAAASDFQR